MKRVVEIPEVELQVLEGHLLRLKSRVQARIYKVYSLIEDLDGIIGQVEQDYEDQGIDPAFIEWPKIDEEARSIDKLGQEIDQIARQLIQLRIKSNQALVSD